MVPTRPSSHVAVTASCFVGLRRPHLDASAAHDAVEHLDRVNAVPEQPALRRLDRHRAEDVDADDFSQRVIFQRRRAAPGRSAATSSS